MKNLFKKTRPTPCPTCGGGGTVTTDKFATRTCPVCHGSGFAPKEAK